MSLGLIKPGLLGAGAVYPKWHAKAGQEVEPLGTLPSGKVVWPALGGAPEEQDDPDNVPGGNPDEDEEDDEEEDDPESKKSSRKSSSDDDDDDEGEDDDRLKASRQAKRYRLALRAEQAKNREMADRLKALEDKDKKPDEIASRDLTELRDRAEKLATQNASMAAQLAFFRANTVTWVDPSDAFALAEREGLFEDVVDEDGNVDARELRRGLRDLAKRKPHLVKATENPKARGRKTADADGEEEEEEEEQSSSTPKSMNRTRRGTSKTPSRAELARKFPVLGRM